MNTTLLDKPATLSRLGNLSACPEEDLIRDLTFAHGLILARKGKQKSALGGVTVTSLRAKLDAAAFRLADDNTPETYTAWRTAWTTLQERADAQEGLEYHYLEQFAEAVRGYLSTRGVRVSCKGDGTVSVRR